MLKVKYCDDLLKTISKVKDKSLKENIKKQIKKIIERPTIGKPMRYTRKGTRELYIGPYRLAYAYKKDETELIFLDLYHKDKQ